MTEISEAAKARACELANKQRGESHWTVRDASEFSPLSALARLVQEHSDVAKRVYDDVLSFGSKTRLRGITLSDLQSMILPEPKDKLWEAWETALDKEGWVDPMLGSPREEREKLKQTFLAELAKLGGRIVFEEE